MRIVETGIHMGVWLRVWRGPRRKEKDASREEES